MIGQNSTTALLRPAGPSARASAGGGARIWLIAAFAALAVAAGIAFPKIGVAALAAGLLIRLSWCVIQRPFTGVLAALWIFPLYPSLRAAYFAYGIPIAMAGSRPWSEVLLVLLFCGLLIAGTRDRKIRLRITWRDLPILTFLLSGIYATVLDLCSHISPLVPFFGWEVSLNAALYYIAIRWLRPDEAETRAILRTVLSSYILIAILSLADYFLHTSVGIKLADATRPHLALMAGRTPQDYWQHYPRLQSFLFEENVWGTFSTFVAIYCLATRGLMPQKASRLYWALFLLAAACLLLTMSRGAMICLAVAVAVLLLIRGRHRSRVVAAAVAVLCVTGGLLAYFASDPRVLFLLRRADTVSVESAQKGTIVSDRAFQWINGWKIFTLYPSGRGLGTVGYAAFLSKGGTMVVADGIYFRVLAEEGVPGELLFVFTLAGTGYILAQGLRRATGWNRVLGVTLLAFHCGFCVQSIGANTYDYYYFPALFWILYAVFVSAIERRTAESAKSVEGQVGRKSIAAATTARIEGGVPCDPPH